MYETGLLLDRDVFGIRFRKGIPALCVVPWWKGEELYIEDWEWQGYLTGRYESVYLHYDR